MRPPTRLLLFVLVPLAVAVGGVAWMLQRQVGTPSSAQRTLPATTQVVSGRPALAWNQYWTPKWATFGFNGPDRWFGATLQRAASFDVAGGLARGGLMTHSTNLKSAITGPAIAANGLLFAPMGTAEVAAIDLLTFRPVWTADVGAPAAHLAADGGRVIGRTSDRVACFDAATGSTRWTVKTAKATAGPAAAGRYACFATDDALHVLDAATGRELRTIAGVGLWDRIVIDGDRGYACARAAGQERKVVLYAFDLARGTIAWQWAEAAPTPPHDIVSAWIDFRGPAVGDGVVVVAIEDRLCAVDVATGRRRWLWQADREVTPERERVRGDFGLVRTPAVIDGLVFATWHGDRVSGFDVASGREVWRYVESDGRPILARVPSDAPPVARDGMLLCGMSGGMTAIQCDPLPKARPSAVTPASRTLNLPRAVGLASGVLLVAIILGVFGLWRLSIAAACAAVCGLTVWAWVRSYGVVESVGYTDVKSTYPFTATARRGITSRGGALAFGSWHRVSNEPRRRSPWPLSTAAAPVQPEWRWEREPETIDAAHTRANLMRFAWTKQSRSSGISIGPQAETSLTLPHWFVAAVLGVAPMAWVTGLWRDRRRRHPRGHCRECGYDLRGIAGRCPECGLEIATKRLFGKVRG